MITVWTMHAAPVIENAGRIYPRWRPSNAVSVYGVQAEH